MQPVEVKEAPLRYVTSKNNLKVKTWLFQLKES